MKHACAVDDSTKLRIYNKLQSKLKNVYVHKTSVANHGQYVTLYFGIGVLLTKQYTNLTYNNRTNKVRIRIRNTDFEYGSWSGSMHLKEAFFFTLDLKFPSEQIMEQDKFYKYKLFFNTTYTKPLFEGN